MSETQSEIQSETSEDFESTKAPLIEHLVELRTRLMWTIAAIFAGFLLCFFFASDIYNILLYPYKVAVGGDTRIEMIYTAPQEFFFTQLKLSLFGAIFLAFPVLASQIYMFVAPGLYKKEKHFAFPLLASSILLFYAGVAFAYYVVFPLVFGFFTAITPTGVEMMTDISAYLDFITTIVLAFGLAFEVPIATVLVVWTGLTTPDKLGKARPYVFLGAFVVGMVLTPPDIISQTLLAVPVYLLYEAGIIMSRFFSKKPEEEEPASVK